MPVHAQSESTKPPDAAAPSAGDERHMGPSAEPSAPEGSGGATGTDQRPRHVFEQQLGGGAAWGGFTGFGPAVHAQARFAMWRTIGLGVFAGGQYYPGESAWMVPLCARVNLSLPFWPSFEPVASLGLGYYYMSRGATPLGAHAALALLFPGRRLGFEVALHVTQDIDYSSELGGYLTAAATALFR